MKGSVSQLIDRARDGDQPGITALYERFNRQMIKWANRQLSPSKCRDFDAEDIAIEAFHAFCIGMEEGRFPDVENRHSLQALLATIVIRKAINRIEKANAQSRGAGQVGGESAFSAFDKIRGHELAPDAKSAIDDEIERCLRAIPDDLRNILQLSLLGYSSAEVARELQCSTRSVQLKKKRIRSILEKSEE